MRQEVVLVDELDQPIGIAEKQKAHIDGALHRAFSIYVFNPSGQLLLQKRARDKYHSGGLWSNSCCGHPQPDGRLEASAQKRLFEEMGFECELRKAFQFQYKAALDNGLIEHEVDHVFLGVFSGNPQPDPAEAEAWKWVNLADLNQELRQSPNDFTYWLRCSFQLLVDHMQQDPLRIVDQLGIHFSLSPANAR